MITFENGKWQPCTWKVTFESRGKTMTQYTNNKERFIRLENFHDHITNMSFEEVVFSDEQNQRLEELISAQIPETFDHDAKKYVETGEFPESYNNPFAALKISKEQKNQNKEIADAFFEIMKVVN